MRRAERSNVTRTEQELPVLDRKPCREVASSGKMTMTADEQASRFRQRIGQHIERLRGLAEVVQGRSKLLAGSLYERKKRCGKMRCRCCRGELHQDIALAVRQEGRSYYASLVGLDMGEVRDLVNHWRQFRRSRREMIRIFKEIVAAVDGLGKLRQTQIGQVGRTVNRG